MKNTAEQNNKNKDSLIRDNYENDTVGNFLRENIRPNSSVRVVSAYFTIFAYRALQTELNTVKNLRFLFGEPSFLKNIDTGKDKAKQFIIDSGSLSIPLEARLEQRAVARECAAWLKEKAEIRSLILPNFLHGKLYHITQDNKNEEAISGSSNFTARGLGLSQTDHKNIELNLIVDSKQTTRRLKDWFETIWANSKLTKNVKTEVLEYLENIYSETAPEFLYFKTLYHIFEEYLQEDARTQSLVNLPGFFDSDIWNTLYDFQQHGVRAAINKILKHNGCIIADSVGLGKTYEALAVIKYFELRNERVLVICPKKLGENWKLYQASYNSLHNPLARDRLAYTVLYHTDIGRLSGKSSANNIDLATFNWSNFDLVVIDESHNFRGDPISKTLEDGTLKLNRAAALMERILKDGVRTKVLMLSATPVNNSLSDLRNQINFICEGKDSALRDSANIHSISQTIQSAQVKFKAWSKEQVQKRLNSASGADTGTGRRESLLSSLDTSFFKLLDELTIARSRSQILSFYNISNIGNFPERMPPQSIMPSIDSAGQFPSYDRINEQIHAYKLSIFSPSEYVLEGKRHKYDPEEARGNINFTQEQREHVLIGIMKVNYLKRLESSIESFKISLNRTICKIDALLHKIAQFTEGASPHSLVDVNATADSPPHSLVDVAATANPAPTFEASLALPSEQDLEDGENDAETDDAWTVGKKLKFELADLDLDSWQSDLYRDKQALQALIAEAEQVKPERDAKLQTLKDLIRQKVEAPKNTLPPHNTGNKKVLVFTAFSDTATYLYKNIAPWAERELGLKSALVTGTKCDTQLGKAEFNEILTQFAPRAKKRSFTLSMQGAGASTSTKNNEETSPNPPPEITQEITQEIDILIATDCISEGQNLQDCDYLVNYDIHWNPVRIIQRFGRIDRIGSTNKTIRLVNFWPTADLDSYIRLKERVESRMALVDISATGDDNPLDPKEVPPELQQEFNFRDNQLRRLQNEILDIEDTDEGISLTDFSLEDFRSELNAYIQENEARLREAPLGLYSLLPAPAQNPNNTENSIIRPGVIFCLRQNSNEATPEAKQLNALAPYLLVYIRTSGEIRYNFAQAKQILEICRQLCQGQTTAHEDLCRLFNQETQHGSNMQVYSDLLKKATTAIQRSLSKHNSQNLTRNPNATLIPSSQIQSKPNNYDLVSWFVLK